MSTSVDDAGAGLGLKAPPIVMALTGASGVVYAARLLQELLSRQVPVHLTISESGRAVIGQELAVDVQLDGSNLLSFMEAADRLLNIDPDDATSATKTEAAIEGGWLTFHHYKNYFTPIASGSFLTRGMVICPCSGATLSGIAHASSTNLIQRAAEVHLKEHRKLIVVPRETPLSLFQLENMQRLAQAGAIVLPASPGWYHGAASLRDLVDFIVARVLDQLGIDNSTIHRWEAGLVGNE
jgi:4-hydroxy-3-polyprenylbenzoate decarboxylase